MVNFFPYDDSLDLPGFKPRGNHTRIVNNPRVNFAALNRTAAFEF
jgi:hypothetical protein